jgi:hypothetical protein
MGKLHFFIISILTAINDKNRYHTKDDLLKYGVVVNSQLDKLVEATRQLKQRYKYVTAENLQTTGLLTEFMAQLGEVLPTWNPLRMKESLEEILRWNSKAWPLSKYILHCVSANRQDMTKNVKAQIRCELLLLHCCLSLYQSFKY